MQKQTIMQQSVKKLIAFILIISIVNNVTYAQQRSITINNKIFGWNTYNLDKIITVHSNTDGNETTVVTQKTEQITEENQENAEEVPVSPEATELITITKEELNKYLNDVNELITDCVTIESVKDNPNEIKGNPLLSCAKAVAIHSHYKGKAYATNLFAEDYMLRGTFLSTFLNQYEAANESFSNAYVMLAEKYGNLLNQYAQQPTSGGEQKKNEFFNLKLLENLSDLELDLAMLELKYKEMIKISGNVFKNYKFSEAMCSEVAKNINLNSIKLEPLLMPENYCDNMRQQYIKSIATVGQTLEGTDGTHINNNKAISSDMVCHNSLQDVITWSNSTAGIQAFEKYIKTELGNRTVFKIKNNSVPYNHIPVIGAGAWGMVALIIAALTMDSTNFGVLLAENAKNFTGGDGKLTITVPIIGLASFSQVFWPIVIGVAVAAAVYYGVTIVQQIEQEQKTKEAIEKWKEKSKIAEQFLTDNIARDNDLKKYATDFCTSSYFQDKALETNKQLDKLINVINSNEIVFTTSLKSIKDAIEKLRGNYLKNYEIAMGQAILNNMQKSLLGHKTLNEAIKKLNNVKNMVYDIDNMLFAEPSPNCPLIYKTIAANIEEGGYLGLQHKIIDGMKNEQNKEHRFWKLLPNEIAKIKEKLESINEECQVISYTGENGEEGEGEIIEDIYDL